MITIEEKNSWTNFFDKRDSFPFSIVRMPYLDSNIPSKSSYSAFGAEILKSATTTSSNIIFQRNPKF